MHLRVALCSERHKMTYLKEFLLEILGLLLTAFVWRVWNVLQATSELCKKPSSDETVDKHTPAMK